MLTPDEFTGRTYGIYEVLCRLAVGGMAEIFLGFARSGINPGRPIVIKRVLTEYSDDNSLSQFLEEARVTARLRGANIARIVDLLNVNEEIILVIEFIRGVNLDELYDSYEYVGQTVPPGLAAAAIRDAALGLVEAHNWVNDEGTRMPIVHRDMTPRNVMVGFDGLGRVLDFGIARVSGTRRRTVAGMVRGTSAYMSPEQAIGQDVDPRSDLFSLGIVFHELLTGRRLFRRENPNEEMKAAYQDPIAPPSTLNPRVPKALDAVVMKMLSRDLAGRTASAQQVIDELTQAMGKDLWPREEIAAELRGRFVTRIQAVASAVARIPKDSLGTDRERRALAQERPGDATIPMTSGGQTPNTSPAWQRPPQGPLPRRVADVPTVTDKPGVAPIEADKTSKVDAVSELPPASGPQRTTDPAPPSVMLSASAQALQQVPARRPKGRAEATARSSTFPRWAIAAAMIAALGVGAFVGKISSLVQRNAALGQLSLKTDRPAQLFFKGRALGQTPITVMLPEGHYTLRLKEPSGVTRVLEADIAETLPFDVEVRLDQLPTAK